MKSKLVKNFMVDDENNQNYRDACKCFEQLFIKYMKKHHYLKIHIKWGWEGRDDADSKELYSFKVTVNGEKYPLKIDADGQEWLDFLPGNSSNKNRINVLRQKADLL